MLMKNGKKLKRAVLSAVIVCTLVACMLQQSSVGERGLWLTPRIILYRSYQPSDQHYQCQKRTVLGGRTVKASKRQRCPGRCAIPSAPVRCWSAGSLRGAAPQSVSSCSSIQTDAESTARKAGVWRGQVMRWRRTKWRCRSRDDRRPSPTTSIRRSPPTASHRPSPSPSEHAAQPALHAAKTERPLRDRRQSPIESTPFSNQSRDRLITLCTYESITNIIAAFKLIIQGVTEKREKIL